MKLIGRQIEKDILLSALSSTQSEMIAVYGRRRVGKTYLIKNVYSKSICFSISGIHNASLQEQLNNFATKLSSHQKTKKIVPVNSWFDAFNQLKAHISSIKGNQKKVLFFDELPWLDTPKSKFMPALEHFWNSWADDRNDIVLVICGSAASWIIKKVLNNKGGLHNRVTKRVRLLPFTLTETQHFLLHKGIKFTYYDICQLYMATGGIPFYLNQITKGESVVQHIDKLCFTKDGLLHNEFDNLYSALFNNANKHIQIIKTLAASPQGLSRNAVLQKSKLPSGGGFTDAITELLESGFITETPPQKTMLKNNLYRLTDEYSLFYLKFIQPNKYAGVGAWHSISQTPSYTAWCGYAFENICFKHIPAIKKALGISGVYSNTYSWQNNHAQIDMLIDREDRCINICEIKYTQNNFAITAAYAQKLTTKIQAYKNETATTKNVFVALITVTNVKQNQYSNTIIQNFVTLQNIFET